MVICQIYSDNCFMMIYMTAHKPSDHQDTRLDSCYYFQLCDLTAAVILPALNALHAFTMNFSTILFVT